MQFPIAQRAPCQLQGAADGIPDGCRDTTTQGFGKPMLQPNGNRTGNGERQLAVGVGRAGERVQFGGSLIEQLRSDLQRIMGVPVHVSIEEIRKPEIDAQLIADSIAQQLEKRIMFRRAMKRAMQNAMRLGAQGIKVMSAGRLNGAEIARSEWYREGRVPLHTLRADIDYATSEALTTYGIIGIKVWVYKGDMLDRNEQPVAEEPSGDDRRSRRAPGKPDGDKPRTRTVKKADGDAAPAKRARKVGA